jgi:hypothetical protein
MMDAITANSLPILGAVMFAGVAWFVRMRAEWQSIKRTKQFENAAEMLMIHARFLQRFLDDPKAPVTLKRVLIEMSDAMMHREIAQKLSDWALSHSFDQPLDTDDTRAIEDALVPLRVSAPDLAECFDLATMAAVAAACFQWIDSTALSERIFSRLVVSPKRDATIVATTVNFRPGMPFRATSAVPALA